MKYNWTEIQNDYDLGFTYRDLIKKYGMSSRTLTVASRKGLLKTRSKSDASKINNAKNPRTHTEEFKQRQRKQILERYENGWMPKAGRCKKYTYSSPIAGIVSLDGTWELAVAKWLDENNYIWNRNTKRFPYYDTKNKLRYYTPDFYCKEFGYIEVKGYETELDRCKWKHFKEPLTVWKRKHLTEMNIL